MKWKAHTTEQVAELFVGTTRKVISAFLSAHAAEAVVIIRHITRSA